MAKAKRREPREWKSDYDGAWKEFVRRHLRQTLEKFFPAGAAAIDWEHAPEWSDKELSRLIGRSKRRPQSVDMLVK